MAWKKGESGNPGGRPKVDKEVQELAREHSVRAIGRLAEWMASDNARASVAACTAILDRAYGKPTQPLANDPENPINPAAEAPTVELVAKLSREQRASIRAILGNAFGTSAADEPAPRPRGRTRKPR